MLLLPPSGCCREDHVWRDRLISLCCFLCLLCATINVFFCAVYWIPSRLWLYGAAYDDVMINNNFQIISLRHLDWDTMDNRCWDCRRAFTTRFAYRRHRRSQHGQCAPILRRGRQPVTKEEQLREAASRRDQRRRPRRKLENRLNRVEAYSQEHTLPQVVEEIEVLFSRYLALR